MTVDQRTIDQADLNVNERFVKLPSNGEINVRHRETYNCSPSQCLWIHQMFL